jgi:hypothetical protein
MNAARLKEPGGTALSYRAWVAKRLSVPKSAKCPVAGKPNQASPGRRPRRTGYPPSMPPPDPVTPPPPSPPSTDPEAPPPEYHLQNPSRVQQLVGVEPVFPRHTPQSQSQSPSAEQGFAVQ